MIRSATVAITSTFSAGSTSRAAGPVSISPGCVVPLARNAPFRPTIARFATDCPPSNARARPCQFAQSPRPSTLRSIGLPRPA